MKYKIYLKAFVATAFYSIAGAIAFLRPDWLLYLTVGLGLMSYFLLVVVFTPAGQVRLGEKTKKPSFGLWFLQLLKGQAVLFIFTLAAYVAFLGAGPTYIKADLSFQTIAEVMGDFTPWKWAIFPWSVYALWGIIVAYSAYVKKGEPFFYQIARQYCPKKLQPLVKTATDSASSGGTITAFSLTANAVILLLVYALEVNLKAAHFAIPAVTVMTLFCLVPFMAFRRGRKRVNKFAGKGMNWLFGFYMIFAVAALFIAALANTWLKGAYPQLYQYSQCPQCQDYFGNVPITVRFGILYWGWWFIWLPIAGSYVAKISYGRTLREVIFGMYLVPLLLFIMVALYGSAPFAWLLLKIQSIRTPFLLITLAMLVWVFFNAILRKRTNTSIFVMGVMPESTAPTDRVLLSTASKKVGLSKYSFPLLMNLLSVLFLHTMAGWYGIQFLVGAMAFPLLGVIYTGFLLLIFWFFKDSLWINNRNISEFSS